MLILRRKKNESLLIGENIRITVIECASDGVRLAIDAPRQISILREELSKAEQSNKLALTPDRNSVFKLQNLFHHKEPKTTDIQDDSKAETEADSKADPKADTAVTEADPRIDPKVDTAVTEADSNSNINLDSKEKRL